jgi:uncharacterized protein (TIGR02271 family)
MSQKKSAEREGTVVGLFRERREAELAIQELKQEGFTDYQMDVLSQDRESHKELVDTTGAKLLVAVKAGSRAEEARQILRGHGGKLEALEDAFASYTSTSTGEDQQHLELREEELRAEKEQVQAGEVRLRKEVVKEKKTIDVPVTREEVVVERHPVSGRQPSDRDIGKDEEIRIPVMEEQVRVEKTPVVKEEVSVKKRAVQETKQVTDTVKREEAYMDQTSDAQVRTGSSEAWRGNERRYHHDSDYTGPERRVAGV